MLRRGLAWTVFGLCAAALTALQWHAFSSLHAVAGDFQAFWCAGGAVAAHADPYRTQSLFACEHARIASFFYSAPPGVVVPAPLPGYALLVFVPFALLPYATATALWIVLMAVSTVVAVVVLARLAHVDALAIAWLLLPASLVLWIPLGEVSPLVFLAIVACAYALEKQRYAAAAALFCVIAIHPQVALPVGVAMALFVPRMRLPLCGAVAALAAAWAATGIPQAFEYVTAVLPLHALGDMPRFTQYSASWLAHVAGAGASASVLTGSIAYAAVVVAGIAVAARVQSRFTAALVLLPAACAVVGGSYVHAAETLFALPLALYVFAGASRPMRVTCACAAAVLVIPWNQIPAEPVLLIATLVSTFFALDYLGYARAAIATTAACAAAALSLLSVFARHHVLRTAGLMPSVFGRRAEYVAASWGQYVWTHPAESQATSAMLFAKLLTWSALAAILFCATALALGTKTQNAPVGSERFIEG